MSDFYTDSNGIQRLNITPIGSGGQALDGNFGVISALLTRLEDEGFSGFSGHSGLSGFSGASITGASGLSGFSGASVSGYSGFSGTNGVIGSNGASGLSGFSGASVSGYSGFSGTNGVIGSDGASGYSGFSGASITGSDGVSGYSGFSGANPGASGYSGFSGFSGSITSTWIYSSAYTTPTAGQMHLNSATPSAITNILVNEVDTANATWYNVMASLGNPQVLMITALDGTTFGSYVINTFTFSGAPNYSFTVSYTNGLGTFNDGDQVLIYWPGPKGATGNSGTSGYSGKSGYSGNNGTNGTNGTSGFSGYSGSGVSGYSGFSGHSGMSGYSGSSTGTSGFSGHSGISGKSGNDGVSGWSGFSGTNGAGSQNLSGVLSIGNEALGLSIDMNDGSGSGGGNIYMDAGNLHMDTGNIYGSPPTSGVTGGRWYLGDASGNTGNWLALETGTLSFDNAATTQADGSGNLTWSISSMNYSGAPIKLNSGGGTGGGVLSLDGGTLDIGTNAGGTPTNTATPAGYCKIAINGTAAWIPYFQ